MSLQDDYFDISDHLKSSPELAKAFDRVWFAYCNLETLDMVRRGQLSEEDYQKWIKNLQKSLTT